MAGCLPERGRRGKCAGDSDCDVRRPPSGRTIAERRAPHPDGQGDGGVRQPTAHGRTAGSCHLRIHLGKPIGLKRALRASPERGTPSPENWETRRGYGSVYSRRACPCSTSRTATAPRRRCARRRSAAPCSRGGTPCTKARFPSCHGGSCSKRGPTSSPGVASEALRPSSHRSSSVTRSSSKRCAVTTRSCSGSSTTSTTSSSSSMRSRLRTRSVVRLS